MEGLDYTGTVNTTRTGLKWKDWSKIYGYESRTDQHNYCRNPDGDLQGPWCFTSYLDFGYCTIPFFGMLHIYIFILIFVCCFLSLCCWLLSEYVCTIMNNNLLLLELLELLITKPVFFTLKKWKQHDQCHASEFLYWIYFHLDRSNQICILGK